MISSSINPHSLYLFTWSVYTFFIPLILLLSFIHLFSICSISYLYFNALYYIHPFLSTSFIVQIIQRRKEIHPIIIFIWLAYQAISSRRPWPLRRPPFLFDCTKFILVFLPWSSIFSPPCSFYDVWLANEDSFARRFLSLRLDAWSLLNDPPLVLFIRPSFCSFFETFSNSGVESSCFFW